MSGFAVFVPRRFGRLLVSDATSISRDPMLLFATLLSVLPSVALWYGRDSVDAAAAASFGVDAFASYLVPVALLVPAMLIGWVVGFLLLEDRDEGPLLAIDVTPVGKSGFFAYRATAAVLVTAVITLMAAWLLLPERGWAMALLLAGLVAANAVLVAAVLPAVARNKVEGLALTKLVNLASVVPLLAILPSPLRYLGGIVPSYWIGELLMLSEHRYLPEPLVATLAIGTHLAAVWLLLRLLARRSG
jgi:fluoroquinolone transport system permease protein